MLIVKDRSRLNQILNIAKSKGRQTRIHEDHSRITQFNSLDTGRFSEVIELTIPGDRESKERWWFPSNKPLEAYFFVKETFTTDSTLDNQETFSLSNDFVDSPDIPQETGGIGNGEVSPTRGGIQDLILYDAGTRKLPTTVDYGNNQFSYEDADTGSTLTVYYLMQDPNVTVQARAYKSNIQEHEKVFNSSMRTMNNLDKSKRKNEQVFGNTFALETKEVLKFLIKSSIDFSGTFDAESFSTISIPVIPVENP